MPGGLSPWHWLLIIAVVALLFGGKGKLSGLMGDAAKGVRAFRDGLKGEGGEPADVAETKPAASLPPTPVAPEPAAKPRARAKAKS